MNNCNYKKKFKWDTRKIKRSPFRTLAAAKLAERKFLDKKPIGFTAKASLKAMGRIPRSTGCYLLGPKYTMKSK
jgi:hypothetical protein